MNQAEIITNYKDLYKRAEAVGLTLKTELNFFAFNNVPGSNGQIQFDDLYQLQRFLRGYELGYKSSLKFRD